MLARDSHNLIVQTFVSRGWPVVPCTKPPLPSAHTHLQQQWNKGSVSMVSLFNIIICVIQHLAFYLFLFVFLAGKPGQLSRQTAEISLHTLLLQPLPLLPAILATMGASLLMK